MCKDTWKLRIAYKQYREETRIGHIFHYRNFKKKHYIQHLRKDKRDFTPSPFGGESSLIRKINNSVIHTQLCIQEYESTKNIWAKKVPDNKGTNKGSHLKNNIVI